MHINCSKNLLVDILAASNLDFFSIYLQYVVILLAFYCHTLVNLLRCRTNVKTAHFNADSLKQGAERDYRMKNIGRFVIFSVVFGSKFTVVIFTK